MQLMEGAEQGVEPDEKSDPIVTGVSESGNEDPQQTQNEVAPSTPPPPTGPASQQATPDPRPPEEGEAVQDDQQGGEAEADTGTREQTQDAQQTSS